MLKSFLRPIAVLMCLAAAADASGVLATHFRFGTLSWRQRADLGPGWVEFELTAAFRRDGYPGTDVDSHPKVGDVILEDIGATTIDPGPGAFASFDLQYEVIAANPLQNWIIAKAEEVTLGAPDKVVLYQYDPNIAFSFPLKATVESCCRTGDSDHINNPDGDYRLETLVDPYSGNSPPRTLLSPIVGCEWDSTCQFFVLATDPDGDPLRWRLSTANEAGAGVFTQPGPPDSSFPLSVDPNTGLVTWNTQNAATSPVPAERYGYYSTQVTIEDLDGGGMPKSKTAVDFFIQVFVPPPYAPKFDVPPTPASGTFVSTEVGQCIAFDLQASDVDPNDVVTIGDASLPPGMNCYYDAPARTVRADCDWVPSAQNVGGSIVVFTATDNNGLSAPPHSFNILITDQCQTSPPSAPDMDGDLLGDLCDNCPAVYNPGQQDSDLDAIGDACDNCGVANTCQREGDGDGLADACDICPFAYNPGQEETDGDGVGDACDVCPNAFDPGQEDADGDLGGDLCDNCPGLYNPGQADVDGDGFGDLCDNCPADANPGQENSDGDNEGGDACDITITFPLQGDVACTDPPPTVTWTPEIYDRFRVFISWNSTFAGKTKVSSGKTLLKTTSWTVPLRKWNRACTKAVTDLYFRVYGKKRGTRIAETSEASPVTVK